MKYLLLILVLTGKLGFTQSDNSCLIDPFSGVNGIFLGSEFDQISRKYTDVRVEKRKHKRTDITSKQTEKVIFLDALGIQIHAKKQRWTDNYYVYHIIISQSCNCRMSNEVGIGTTYAEIANTFPQLLNDYKSRLIHTSSPEKVSKIKIYNDTIVMTFLTPGWVNEDDFYIREIEITSHL